MKCPNDDTVLQMTERQGVEIDYCPTCRGVWLDRGELDKILERSRSESRYDDDDDDRREARRPDAGYPERRDDDWERDRARNPRGYDEPRPSSYPSSGHYPPKKKRRGSFLEDLLDFG